VRLVHRDEIGELGAAFDEMADALGAKDADLRAHAALLEQRVEERTATLRRLEEASAAFGRSLDLESTARTLARVLAPDLADLCLVDVRDHRGTPRVHHVEAVPAVAGLAGRLWHDPTEIFESDDLTTWTITLGAGGEAFGRLLLANAPGRRWSDADRALVQEVARRGSLALANALLFHVVQEANRVKDEFLGTVSHELRTPLNAVLGWTRILATVPPDAALQKRATAVIERNAGSLARLVDELLDVSRISADKLLLDVRTVDLAAVARAAVDSMMPSAGAKGIALTVDAQTAVVNGDPQRLHQVCSNLLANAIKFTAEGGRVRVTVALEGANARLTVEDDGVGIDEEFLPHVFEPFRQADSTTTRSFGGLGLGLAVVHRIVEMHGGEVTAASDGRGRGSRFTVSLAAPVGTTPVADLPAPPFSGSLAGREFLFVDDEPDSREVVAMMLESYDARVMTVGSAAAAIACLEAGVRPHVLLVDIGMPGEDGYSLMRRIRTSPVVGIRHIPAVALTAYAGPHDRQQAIAAGFDDHVAKPVDLDAFLSAVQRALETRRAADAGPAAARTGL
jgi:signal transduction histidine kinase/CheY-like chemotaxis protein